MGDVAVITGGAGGMGVATAALVGRDHTVVLADNRADRLDGAARALGARGVTVRAVHCDVTDRAAVTALLEVAAEAGRMMSVIHTAGISPSMACAEEIMRTNAIGTVNVGEAFLAVAAEGAAVVAVASMAAHLLPDEVIPADRFPLALQDPDAFLAEMTAACAFAPEEARCGYAYAVSKNFVRWYATAQSERFGERGLRIVSVSPGSIDTEMGRLEADAGAGAMVADAAVPRWGTAEEMAELLGFCASPRAGYLTGTDILNDGGVVASVRDRVHRAARQG